MSEMRSITDDQTAAISLDFMTAIAIFVVAFLYVVYSLSGAITPYTGESKSIYPVASRMSEMLVSDPGAPENWENDWKTGDYANVGRIGLAVDNESHNVLDKSKVDALMHSSTKGLTWWEFGAKTNTTEQYDNATRALGLKPYDFYMQIRPINTTFNNYANQNVTSAGDICKIERIVTIKDGTYAEYRLILWMW